TVDPHRGRKDERLVLRLALRRELERRARRRREAVSTRKEQLVRLVTRRQTDRRERTGPGAQAGRPARLVVDPQRHVFVCKPRAVVAAGHLELSAAVADGRLDDVGLVVDRVRRELETAGAAGRAAAEDSRAVLLFVAETDLHVPARAEVLRTSQRQDVALGLELDVALRGRRRRVRNVEVRGADA